MTENPKPELILFNCHVFSQPMIGVGEVVRRFKSDGIDFIKFKVKRYTTYPISYRPIKEGWELVLFENTVRVYSEVREQYLFKTADELNDKYHSIEECFKFEQQTV